MNIFFKKPTTGTINIYDMNGKTIKTTKINGKQKYLKLNDIPTGMYIYQIKTSDGQTINGKYLKTNKPPKGPSNKPNNWTRKNNGLKETTTHEAKYQIKWTKKGYYTDSTTITIHDGENDPIWFYLTPIPIPDPVLRIGGTAWYLNPETGNCNTRLKGVLIKLEIPSLDTIITTYTNDTGYFQIDSLPLNTKMIFGAGNIDSLYSIDNYEWTSPNIKPGTDSLIPYFGIVLPTKNKITTTNHISNQNGHGTLMDTVYYYISDDFRNTQKDELRENYKKLQNDENNSIIYIESKVPRTWETTGVNLHTGTNNTNTDEEWITTPLGDKLYPTRYANTSLSGTGDYVVFVHETKRQEGYEEVGWYSVMRGDAPGYTDEDRFLGKLSNNYWKQIYKTKKTFIPIRYLEDSVNTTPPTNKK